MGAHKRNSYRLAPYKLRAVGSIIVPSTTYGSAQVASSPFRHGSVGRIYTPENEQPKKREQKRLGCVANARAALQSMQGLPTGWSLRDRPAETI
jgi:hypothetical protein